MIKHKYSREELHNYAQLCSFSYLNDPDQISEKVNNLGIGKFSTRLISMDDAQAVLVRPVPEIQVPEIQVRKSDLIVAFRGTEVGSINDWFDDLNFTPEPLNIHSCSGVCPYVHRGFLSATKLLMDVIFKWAFRDSINSITFIGHSLGGAMAVLAAALYANVDLGQIIRVVTFGAPPVGDTSLNLCLDRFEIDATRVVNQADRVPRIFSRLKLSSAWEHYGDQVFLKSYRKNNMLSIGNVESVEDHRAILASICMSRIRGMLTLRPFVGIRDHYISSYIKALS